MDEKLKSLRAGIEEMRSVAQKLMVWAADLERSFLTDAPESAHADSAASVPASAPVAPVSAAPTPAVASAVASPPTRAEVKAFLTSRCAAGYSAQVKALIASFGVSSLSEVPEGSLGSLMEAAQMLGDGEANAG